MKKRVDYDSIAGTYNQRYEADPNTPIAQTLLGLVQDTRPERVLEAGCGTGRWLGELHEAVPELVGLDFSIGMLREGQKQTVVTGLLQGRAGHLPFADGSFDMVFCVNAIHHFMYPQEFVREAFRLLRPGGLLAVIGSDPHEQHYVWYVHDYFEGVRALDLQRFPSWGAVRDWMTAAGFDSIEWQMVEIVESLIYGRAIFEDPFLKKHATSQLALLSDERYEAGLRRMEEFIRTAEARGEELSFPVKLPVGAMIARRA